jgi:uncharacterized protein with PIN domain
VSRLRKFYERRFGELMEKQMDDSSAVERLFEQADRFRATLGPLPTQPMASLHAQLRRAAGETSHFPKRFVCDVGLGGLTRWLRGAGYEAFWRPDLDDAAVIREADRYQATLITTDTLMTERGVLRDAITPWVLVPSSLTCEEQLVIVFHELELPLLDSRCMHCGGGLRQVKKAEVIERIPPRTALWLDEYFLCVGCGHLFWRGTHWKQIDRELRSLHEHAYKLGRF